MEAEITAPWVAAAQRLSQRAWAWLDTARDQFTLPTGIPPRELDLMRHIKPIMELALAGSIAIREGTTGSQAAQIASSLVEFSWRQFDCGELLYELQRERPLDTIPLEAYAWFVCAGYRNPRLDTLLAHLTGLRATRKPELLPNRVLGVVNAERVAGLTSSWSTDELVTTTWLGGGGEPWMADLDTLYQVTHTVFHLTDWAARPAGLPAALQDYLHAWLPAWLEVYLEAGHWDVVGEMLMVDLCLTEPDFPVAAWERLADAQHPDGMLPAEPGRDTRTAATVVRNHYHSTVIATIAGTLGISRRLDPRRR